MDNKRKKSLTSSSRRKPLSIDEELWKLAEERALEILWTIEPNTKSEMNRKGIIDYVQGLIKSYYGPEAQVFTFGSVPLKTYLPDGDIDLTILSNQDADEEDLALEVKCLVGSGDDPEYEIEEGPLYIPAQVQLVKCKVKRIPVDITFNQMAGIYTLRFLEQVDKIVGKKHLFKRSIILIKAWCYYESRILGAHFGLLSTYAVETLVLYIINRFHSSVRGPLEVLYKFLEYYSSFDWDHNYISIWGARPLSSLPGIVEIPECERGEFLLQKEFLRTYRDMCSYSAKASETATHEFPAKFLNILDPLRNDNNLGRSLNFATFSRMKLAFSCGVQKLRRILRLPGQHMGAALEEFFGNTLERNGRGQRADVNVPVPAFGTGRAEESVLRGDCDSYYGALQFVQQYRKTLPPSSPLSPSQKDTLAPSMKQKWSGGDVHAPPTHQNWNEGDLLAPATHQNWSEEDVLAQSAQQNWSMYNQSGEAYIQGQSLHHPTHSHEEGGKSRGTGTYIPDLKYNYYWNLRAKTIKARKNPYAKYNTLLKSPLGNQQAGEAHSATALNANSKPFEPANEDFPYSKYASLIKSPLGNQQAEEAHSETEMNANPKPFELTNEDFHHEKYNALLIPLGNQQAEEAHSETEMNANSKPFELANEDFPYAKYNPLLKLPLGNQQAEETHSETEVNADSKPFELANEDFPELPGIPKAIMPPQVQESAPLAKVHSETDMDSERKLSEISNEDFPCPPKVHSETDMDSEWKLSEISNEDFPCPPKVHSETDMDSERKLSEISNEDFPFPPKVHPVTNLDGNSESFELLNEEFPPLPKVSSVTNMVDSSRSFELTDEDFPLLQSTYKTISSKSSQLSKQDKSSSPSELEGNEFGTNKISQSLTELSLSTKDEEEASGVSYLKKLCW